MKKKVAINLAIEAIRHQIKEKAWDAAHPINEYGERCKKMCSNWEEAIKILESMKGDKDGGK